MAKGAPELASLPVPPGAGPLVLGWSARAGVDAWIVCRLPMALSSDHWGPLAAGSFDAMIERHVLRPEVTRAAEDDPSGFGHRVVLARLPAGRLEPAEGLTLARDAGLGLPRLTGPPARSWGAAPHAGTPPEDKTRELPEATPRKSQTRVEEPGGAGPRLSKVIERPLAIRELGASATPRLGGHATPLEAYEHGVRPGLRPGGTLPDLKRVKPPLGLPPDTQLPTADESVPPTWVVLGDPELVANPVLVRGPLRTLRGWFKLALSGSPDRSLLERRATLTEVPFDVVYALASDSSQLAPALGCSPGAVLVIVREGQPTPAGTRRRECGPDGLAALAAALVGSMGP